MKNIQKRSCNYKKTTKTLDYCHKNNLENFQVNKNKLEQLKNELQKLEKSYESILNIPNCEKSDDDFKNIVIFNDKIISLQNEIHDIENNRSELNYYINTSDILYNYYDLVENNSDNNMNIVSNSNKKTILDYFAMDTKSNNEPENIEVKDKEEVEYNRASLLDEYLSYTDINYINNNIDNTLAYKCSHCGSLDKTILYNDSIIYCNGCHSIEHLLTDNEKPSYKDPPKEISYFSYKRINHYQEWLNQIQGKETTDIPENVFDEIMLELKKQRITNIKDIKKTKIKEILKKLKINKYYEHIPYILNRITGIPNPNLSQDLEDKLKNMFREIQVPFLKHSPLQRKNFLSYSYVLHKFIQLLGKDEYLEYFPLLKSRDKLHQQEQIWKNICDELGWKFIRSM